jgi:putative ABC transport system permease protein
MTITPGYLEAMGVPLLRGRLFDEHDSEAGRAVIIVDDELAQKFWPGTDPIGKRAYVPDTPQDLQGPNDHTKWLTVVGVVGTVRLEDLAQRSTAGAYYFPAAQDVQRGLSLAIKTTGNPADTLRALRARINELDSTMLLSFVRTMDEYTALSLMPRRTTMLLATGFAIISLFLSAIGIYGVLSFLVTQRFREIGIRIALGSTSLRIFALVLREGTLLVAGGLVLGIIGAAWLDQALQNQIYGLQTLDPVVTAIVISILGLIALAACWLPARCAMHVDPVKVLNRQ